MRRWLKVLLIVGGSGIVLVGLAIGGFAWWLGAHKAELRAKGAEAESRGREYARGKDSNACINESLVRLEHAGGIVEQALLRVFLKGCLQSAARDPGLCAGVPATKEILKSASWRNEICAAHGKPSDQACGQLFGTIQEVCHPTAGSPPWPRASSTGVDRGELDGCWIAHAPPSGLKACCPTSSDRSRRAQDDRGRDGGARRAARGAMRAVR
jgi:hypothetical protein